VKILLLGSKRKYGNLGKGYFGGWFEELFREELIRTPKLEVYPFGWGYCTEEWGKKKSIIEKVEELGGVDVILVSFCLDVYEGFNDIDALKVHLSKDFYYGITREYRYYRTFGNMKYDLIFSYSSIIKERLEKENIGKHNYLLPFGVDIGIHRKLEVKKKYDVGCFYTTASKDDRYSFRLKIRNMIKKMPLSSWTSLVYFWNMVEKINQCKICINYSPVPIVNPRVTEVLACGTFLLTNYCEDYTRFGYKDRKHLVFYEGLDDLAGKINFYLEDDARREKIARRGMKHVRKHYNNTTRVKNMVNIIKRHL